MKRLLALLGALLLAGCATPQNSYDPLEPMNRAVYAVNRDLDKKILLPITRSYVENVPQPVQTGVKNFFGNIDDFFDVFASAAQFKATKAVHSFSRVLVNTTAGLGGVIDWGTDLGMQKSDEDFGQVLGFYGVPSGPYLMVPFYGPVTLRDSAEPIGRYFMGPLDFIQSAAWDVGYYSLWIVDARSEILPLDGLLSTQPDEYAYLRDGYLQRRWNKIHDGYPPYPLPLGEPDDAEGSFDPGPTDVAAPVSDAASAPLADDASSSVSAMPETGGGARFSIGSEEEDGTLEVQ
ncbi:MlaA family lipoprotein [Chitinolyticbacter albus]|uniref:MlaA family lipoprotein n=1 Tax=Chitinolyticbacter albus TaxID=2961951 RepID=UPI002108C2E0|nr:VacJ family lipoprotein [Chitinolyticbacter albus]